ncbi:protein UL79 [Panine betaherpesvirus 2]|uniref:Protein UL79 n=1 Tax=Panine betaherpesvirus 2 TaxID=188763 RepID=Q8QS20_9BETA|nr:protein UL79 [Panine betaherpesvirus 2]AAM00718.1 protein UL79 [Panine betaherpesvirus 2]QXV67828.1 protein UL79 [Panine betaherpesvirus 2]
MADEDDEAAATATSPSSPRPQEQQQVRTGKFSFTCANHLILQISEKMSRGQPLHSLRLEELKILRLICVMLFHRGLETLLLRETMNNLGVSDNAVLSRKTPQPYWPHLYRELTQAFPGLDFNAAVFDEACAARLSQRLLSHPRLSGGLLTRFVRRHTGLLISFPEDLARNGNILFSLGTLYGHRLFRLAAFFTRHWGADTHEPLIRIICQKMWYFYLIGTGKMRITPDAFEIQRSRHETGIFTFIMEDYRTFAGTLSLHHYHRPHNHRHPRAAALSPEAVAAARALHMPALASDA